MKMIPFTVLIALILLATDIPVEAARSNIITRLNQDECGWSIVVDAHTNTAQNYYSFTIAIPKNDQEVKRLFRIGFVLGTGGRPYPSQLTVPVETKENERGDKVVMMGASAETLHNTFIQFDCFRENPMFSSLDTVFLKLDTYVSETK